MFGVIIMPVAFHKHSELEAVSVVVVPGNYAYLWVKCRLASPPRSLKRDVERM